MTVRSPVCVEVGVGVASTRMAGVAVLGVSISVERIVDLVGVDELEGSKLKPRECWRW